MLSIEQKIHTLYRKVITLCHQDMKFVERQVKLVDNLQISSLMT